MSGHVFITQGDLTKLACDAWLLPTDVGLRVEEWWWKGLHPTSVDQQSSRLNVKSPSGWGTSVISQPIRAPIEGGSTIPWMTSIGSVGPDLRSFLDGIKEFVRSASHQRKNPGHGRAKTLLALPVVGSGQGGGDAHKGDIQRALVSLLHHLADEHDVDLALVAHDTAAFAAAQNERRRLFASQPRRQPSLSIPKMEEARRLGTEAAAGRLVLFLGAGVGVSAGLPLWTELIDALAPIAELSEREIERFRRFSVTDQASLLETRLGRAKLAAEVATLMRSQYHGLGHSLLAALPVKEVVTTNYDALFELASRGAGRNLTVLPYNPDPAAPRWILKLHGSIDRADIVLTRGDYMQLNDQRAALAGIVQALLITRHMLFVGYSLSDDDFHQIAHDVRKAVRGDQGNLGGEPFGTALVPTQDELLQDLWRGDIRCIGMESENADISEAGRAVEIMLDAILAESTVSSAYLLDDSYDAVLSEDDRRLRVQLEALSEVAESAADSAARRMVTDFLHGLGGSSL